MREKAAAAAARGGDGGGYGGGYGGGGYHGGGPGISIDTYDANMQVLVNIADAPSPSGLQAAAGAPAAAGAGAGASAAAGGSRAPSRPGQPQPRAAGAKQQNALDAAIAAIKGNPNLSEEDKTRHIAFQQQLAAQKAAAHAVGKQVAVPWLQSKFAGQQPGAAAAAAAGGDGHDDADDKSLLTGLKPDPDDQPPPDGVKREVPGGRTVKSEVPGALAAPLPSQLAASGIRDDQPPAKRQRGLGQGVEGSVKDLDWVGDAVDLVGGSAPAPAVAPPQPAAATPPPAAAAVQQHAEEEDEEEWEDVV